MPMGLTRVDVPRGSEGTTTLPASEVCMHLKVAGKTMRFRLTETDGVQLLNADGTPFSFPILPSEAGLYRDMEGRYYVYENEEN